jgi:peroxiredoxin
MKHSLNSILFILLAVSITVTSCKPKDETKNKRVVVKGILQRASGLRLVLSELDVNKTIALDSIELKNDGSFIFVRELTQAMFLQLSVPNQDPLTLVALPGEEVSIEATADSLVYATITGSDDSRLLQTYFIETLKNRKKTEELADKLFQSRYKPGFIYIRDSLMRVYDRIVNHQRLYVKKFIRKHPGSLSALIVLNQKFGQSVILDENKDSTYFYMVDTALAAQQPENKHTLNHHKRLAEKERKRAEYRLALSQLQPGKPAPDFAMADEANNTLSLSSFKGKKVVLVFWASWDNVAMGELLEAKKGLERLRKNGTEILGVSFDYKKEMWVNAIKNAGLKWKHVCDCKYPDSPVKTIYCIGNQLPVYFFIDEDGRIEQQITSTKALLLATQ